MTNLCYIYQPHYNTNSARVAVNCQQAEENYIIITCSPSENGLYKWKKSDLDELQFWTNGKLPCYVVPMNKCAFIKSLQEIKNEDIIKEIKKQQKKWYNKEVKNRDYEYKKGKPEWML